jgi:predicted RNA-binding protein with PIN domain
MSVWTDPGRPPRAGSGRGVSRPPGGASTDGTTALRLIVDTFNVLHAWTGGPVAGPGRDVAALAHAIAASEFGSWKATLVCDGAPPAHLGGGTRFRSHGAEVLYAGGGRDADSLIERLVDASDAPRRVLVVSSDRRVQRAGRRRGGRAMDSVEFVRRLAHTRGEGLPAPEAEPEPSTDDAELAEWLRIFGGEAPPTPPPPPPQPRAGRKTPSAPAGPPEAGPELDPGPSDPLLDDARRAWPGRIRAEDLDMERWLDDADPDPPGGGERVR